MSQPYSEPSKNKTVRCAKCGNVHQYFDRKYSATNEAGLRFLECPTGCGGLAFDDVTASKSGESNDNDQ